MVTEARTPTFGISLLPSGKPWLDPGAPDAMAIEARAGQRLTRAFAQGPGHGLLDLGAVELDTVLPPSAHWFREIGHRFMTRLSGHPDLEALRERVTVSPSPGELDELLAQAPPLRGGELLSPELLDGLWSELSSAFRAQMTAHDGSAHEWLRGKHPVWNSVGQIVLHLAENKNDAERPFAFLATQAAQVSRKATVRHVPLGRAIEEGALVRDQQKLVGLLEPLQRASEKSELVRRLLDSGEVFHPLAWTTAEAHAFLKELPALEAAGLRVRVPDWWKARRRPVVNVKIGGDRPAGMGGDTLLDFDVSLTLDGEELTAEDLAEIERVSSGLALIRGRWVEVDHEKLKEALGRWQEVERATKDGLAFHDAMRMLSGAAAVSDATSTESDEREWIAVEAGDWLRATLETLRSPEGLAAMRPGKELQATLRPYQEIGLCWLWTLRELGLGGCLADDMGLGKTIQVIALLVLLKRRRDAPSLLVVPASLLDNWQAEIRRFAPTLRTVVAHPSAIDRKELAQPPKDLAELDAVITSYGSLLRWPWLSEKEWAAVVLDEAQAIKNPGAKQARAAKALRARLRLALTGTPIENRLADLWSIFDFACPGLLGSQKSFSTFAKRLASSGDYAPLRSLVEPYVLRRLKTDRRVIADLPEKTEMLAWCSLSKQQAGLYQQAVTELARELGRTDGMKRRGLILAALMRLKQICNHPSHWLKDGEWQPKSSGKLLRLGEIVEPIAARQDKALIFTQFREMTSPLASFLAQAFGREGLVLHGETKVARRADLVKAFQAEDGPPFFVLSLKAGGTGLNLTAASHVIHFDRWWNPAVENQATDRAFRIGQKKNVIVHKLVCRGTVEEQIDRIIGEKRELSDKILQGGGEALLTELPDEEILRLVSLDLERAMGDA